MSKKGKKNTIFTVIAFLLAVPSILCIVLFIKIGSLESYIKSNVVVKDDVNTVESAENSAINIDNKVNTIENDGLDDIFTVSNTEENVQAETLTDYKEYDGIIKVCLTFDDGPSANTDAILDILADYGIKATFFVNGNTDYEDELKRIVDEGHAIGMHSYSHSYRRVYKDLDSFADDLYEIQSYIADVTGVESTIYRFPGGSSNKVSNVSMADCIDYLKAKGIEYYDWNASANDAVAGGASVNTIVSNVMRELGSADSDTYIVLLHDSGDKRTTVEALPIIIEKIADMSNVAFVPITDDITPVHHIESDN